MDALKNALGGGQPTGATGQQQQGQSGGGFMDNLQSMGNQAMGGGQAGEQKEDYLDKGVDFVQERFMGAGDQSNENAAEQFKDEQISDAIRDAYKKNVGSDFPVADK